MGKKQKHSHKQSEERDLKRIRVTIDSLLRARLKLPPSDLANPFPVDQETALAYLRDLIKQNATVSEREAF